MRAFLAVPADPAWVESARDLVAGLRAVLPRASWTQPEAWHLTLKFLGDIPEEAAEKFGAAIGPRVAAAPAGEVAASGALVFPPRGRARVVGIGLAAGSSLDSLAELAAVAEAEARKIGAVAEERTFHPHVTLGRVRDPWPPEAVVTFRRATDAWTFPAWRVRSCVLYRSRLDPAGAVHTPVGEWAMAGSGVEVRA